MMQTSHATDAGRLLLKAFLDTGVALGLSHAELGAIVGTEPSTFQNGRLAPESRAGDLALQLIRAHRALYGLVGGDQSAMHHWMRTANTGTGGIPVEQAQTVKGLATIVAYLEGMGGQQ